jgi:hypothetical protein
LAFAQFYSATNKQPAQQTAGVQLAKPTSAIFHFRRVAFFAQLKAKVGSTLDEAAALRINLNIDGSPITSRTHTHPSHL